MNIENMSLEELKERSIKKVKRTGKYTRDAILAQCILWEDFSWADRDLFIKDNGIIDRDINDIYYNGYDEEK